MRRASLPLLVISLGSACAPSVRPTSPVSPTLGTTPLLLGALLAIHNRERRAFGVPPVIWDPAIAAQAAAYARDLAPLGRLQHAPKALRPGQGENLWMGSRGGYSFAAMADAWAGEKRHFRPGRFPAISTTRNWADVGHFTQMIWPSTSRIGCGVASAGQWDVLVCRYAPAGNVDGVMIPPR